MQTLQSLVALIIHMPLQITQHINNQLIGAMYHHCKLKRRRWTKIKIYIITSYLFKHEILFIDKYLIFLPHNFPTPKIHLPSRPEPHVLLSSHALRLAVASPERPGLSWRKIPAGCGKKGPEKNKLVGGWTNPSEKYARQMGNLPQRVVKIFKVFETTT